MTAGPRAVEEIRADIVTMKSATNDLAGMCSTQGRVDAMAELAESRARLAVDVEPLLARLAAADRENAELRGEVERLARERDAYRKAKSENDERFMLERDDLRAQLAATQAQLAEAHGEYERVTATASEVYCAITGGAK